MNCFNKFTDTICCVTDRLFVHSALSETEGAPRVRLRVNNSYKMIRGARRTINSLLPTPSSEKLSLYPVNFPTFTTRTRPTKNCDRRFSPPAPRSRGTLDYKLLPRKTGAATILVYVQFSDNRSTRRKKTVRRTQLHPGYCRTRISRLASTLLDNISVIPRHIVMSRGFFQTVLRVFSFFTRLA